MIRGRPMRYGSHGAFVIIPRGKMLAVFAGVSRLGAVQSETGILRARGQLLGVGDGVLSED